LNIDIGKLYIGNPHTLEKAADVLKAITKHRITVKPMCNESERVSLS